MNARRSAAGLNVRTHKPFVGFVSERQEPAPENVCRPTCMDEDSPENSLEQNKIGR